MSQTTTTRGRNETGGRPPRSIYLDTLRALALSRVVIYHVVAVEWLTIVAAMPIMFFVAGSLFAASLDRRPAFTVMRGRYRRILVPYWIYIAAMLALWAWLGALGELTPANWLGVLFPVFGPVGPGEGTDLGLTWIALWYLQFHLILSLVGPLLRRAQTRRPLATWLTLGTLMTLGFAAGAGVVVPLFYVGCWILGYHQHDGHLEPLARRRWPFVCAVAGPAGLALYLAFLPSSEGSGVALRLAALGALLIGLFWLTLALGLRAKVEPLLDGRATRATIHWFSQRSLTIYMWHMAVLYAVLELQVPGWSPWPTRLVWVMAGCVLAVVVTGWSEDLAARRRATLWPRLSPRTS